MHEQKARGVGLIGVIRGIARILDKGVLDYVRKARAQKFKPRPLIYRKVKVQIITEKPVLNVASKLAQVFGQILG